MDKWQEISIKVKHEAVEAVAEMLREIGAPNGVAIDDPVLINTLRNSGTWELCDIPQQENTEVVTVTAYFPEDTRLQDRLQQVEQELEKIAQRIGDFQFGPTLFRTISEHDWANEWKQYFHTTKIGQRLVIKPTWEKYEKQKDELIIAIDPGMAFGTGTHHTTAMCMQTLEEIVRPESTVFDIGTGSGILAMAATLLGAKEVKAVDIDLTAVKVAKENIALNHLEDKIAVAQGDLLVGTDGQADIIIANIIADIIIMVMPDIPSKLKSQGLFLTSGIIAERKDDVLAAAKEHGLVLKECKERGGWVALVLGKEE